MVAELGHICIIYIYIRFVSIYSRATQREAETQAEGGAGSARDSTPGLRGHALGQAGANRCATGAAPASLFYSHCLIQHSAGQQL